MKLLVSVATAGEAHDAVAGGADIVDAKDPSAGPLGPVSPITLHEICSASAHARPVSAALGDAVDAEAVERAAAAAAPGVSAVKIGFAGRPASSRVRALIEAAVRGARARGALTGGHVGACGVFAVAYADWRTTHGPSPQMLLEAAAGSGAAGVLIDTADKTGPGLASLVDGDALARWVLAAHDAGLQVALAGKLRAEDVRFARDAGADIIGVRGAVCDGDRTGRVNVEKVRRLVGLRTAAVP